MIPTASLGNSPGLAALAVDHLSMIRGGHRAVADVSWSISEGSAAALVGANGAGKTSTLEVLAGLLSPSHGTATVLGRSPTDPSIAPIRGVMLQEGGLPTGVTVERLLTYLSGFYSNPRAMGEVLEWLALGSLAGKVIRRLSGGEQRRVACAAALIGRPSILLLDEPTAGLDPAARSAFYRVLAQQRDEGCTILFATHIYEDITALAESVIGMREGHLVINESVAKLTEGSEAIRFIGPRGLDLTTLRQVLPADVEVDSDVDGHVTVAATSPSVVATTATWCGANFIAMDTFTVGTLPLQMRISQLLAASPEGIG